MYCCLRLWLILVIGMAALCRTVAQQPVADSLAGLLKKAGPDTTKVILLNDLAWELKLDDPDRARTLLKESLALSRRLNFTRGEGTAYNFLGVIEDIHGSSEEAITHFEKALAIRRGLGDKKGVASLYNNIGNVKENLGDYPAALDNYYKSLRIREELGDTARMVRIFYNIAILNEEMGNYPEALDNIFLYLESTERTGDPSDIANGWNIVGNIKTEIDRFEEALEAYEKALAIHRKAGNEWEVASVLNNIANLKDSMAERKMDDDELDDSVSRLFEESGQLHREALAIRVAQEDTAGIAEIYNNMGYVLKNVGSFYKKSGREELAEKSWAEAERYLMQSLQIREKAGDRAGIMEGYNGIADVRRRQLRFPEALTYTRKYYEIALEINDQKYQQNALKDLARIHFNLGNYKLAYQFRKDYDELRYDRFNEDRIKDEERREALYSDRKKQYEIQRQEQALLLQQKELDNAMLVRNSLIGGAILLFVLAIVLLNRNKIIRTEKQRSENLLLNILPVQTADELKKNGKTKARYYPEVTVLFTDFEAFTKIAETTSPEELVSELDRCFQAFDEIISKYNIEKIKTIGDAYLCAAGLPVPSPTHATDIVRAALEIQAFMAGFRKDQVDAGKSPFYCRIGIHSGPVVAGVVGKKKFAYDIWGDTVNIAARMEQSGEINEINISQHTYELVKDRFSCESRGKIYAKNKGDLNMYFVKQEMTEKIYEKI